MKATWSISAMLVALLAVTACNDGDDDEEERSAGTGGAASTGTGGGTGNPGGGDACSNGCQHLTDCQLCITDTAGNCLSTQQCASACSSDPAGPTIAQCVINTGSCDANAISACMPSSGGGGGGGGECDGCFWDGSACTWCSSSDWGSGPYSGACSSCASSCCG